MKLKYAALIHTGANRVQEEALIVEQRAEHRERERMYSKGITTFSSEKHAGISTFELNSMKASFAAEEAFPLQSQHTLTFHQTQKCGSQSQIRMPKKKQTVTTDKL